MLSPELLARIRRIHVSTSRAVDAMMAGQYRSIFRGAGIEFEEVREYTPGDEVKSIDWKVTARMGRPFVKRYREERELVLMLLVDMSASGLFGTSGTLKRETMAEAASILAFNAIRSNDKVGLVLFTDAVESYIPPKKGTAHVWRVIKEILDFAPHGRGTDIGEAARFLSRVMRKRCVAFFISDFLDNSFLEPLKRARKRHDCIAAVVRDTGAATLPEAGLLEAMDLETGERLLLDCGHRATRRDWAAFLEHRERETLAGLARAGIDAVPLAAGRPPADALHRFFKARERRMRA